MNRPSHKDLVPTKLAMLICASLVLTPVAQADQDSLWSRLGWMTKSPGSEVDSQSHALVADNKTTAAVTSTGGSASLLANVAGLLKFKSNASANAIGLHSQDVRNSQLNVSGNQAQGSVKTLGGVATANGIELNGGDERKSLSDTKISVSDNRSNAVEAVGADADVALGLGSLQLQGRAMGNGVMANQSDVRQSRIDNTANLSTNIRALGGSTLGNALTVNQSTLAQATITQTGNQSADLLSGGGSAGLGYDRLANAKLVGVAAANSVVIANSEIKGANVLLDSNEARNFSAIGGAALGNSAQFSDYRGGSLSNYQARLVRNTASNVSANGGEGSVLGGALAGVKKWAVALANTLSVSQGQILGNTEHTLADNTARQVRADGGGAAANSIWLTQANMRSSPVDIVGNVADNVSTSGLKATVGGGVIGSFEQRGRALANSLVVDGHATLQQTYVRLSNNNSSSVQGYGGLAAAGSVRVNGAQAGFSGSTVYLANNQANTVEGSGFANSLGGGALYSSSQDALALTNSLGVFDSRVDADQVLIADNKAEQLTARGGKLMANSVSVEGGDASSTLSARTSITGNTAQQVQTGAGSRSGPLHLASSNSNARAATNSVVLRDNASTDHASSLLLQGNVANQVRAVGGTALVNSLGAYRGARINSSAIVLTNNDADTIHAGGGSGQTLGVGKSSNGILIANGVYLDGNGAVTLAQTPVSVRNNQARNLQADGGRISANALALNGSGSVQGSSVELTSNSADDLRSQGSEATLAGFAVNKGVGNTLANAAQIFGRVVDSTLALFANDAKNLAASKGLAAANSVVVDSSGLLNTTSVAIGANASLTVHADADKTALAASLHTDGEIASSIVTIAGNQASATTGKHDALAASVSNGSGASLVSSQIVIMGNRGSALGGGTVNSVINRKQIQSSELTIANNRGQVKREGTVNSVENDGVVQSSRIMIVGNIGTAEDGGLVNSVRNTGRILGAKVLITGNQGSSLGGGTVNSVDNKGLLTGDVVISNNNGRATGNGTINSLINHGQMTGKVSIANSQGSVAAGGISNSVINRGAISGKVSIAGSAKAVSGAGAGNLALAANGVIPAGVIKNSIIVGR